jgi:hypothetical protein
MVMVSKVVKICFQEETYNRLRQMTNEKKVSKFVNEAVEEKLKRVEREKGEEAKRCLIKGGYQKVAKSKEMRAEDKV